MLVRVQLGLENVKVLGERVVLSTRFKISLKIGKKELGKYQKQGNQMDTEKFAPRTFQGRLTVHVLNRGMFFSYVTATT